MPRQARIDASLALHQIIIRGIEAKSIFEDGKDREDFLERLSGLLKETMTPCYAWALMTNHIHLLLRTGTVPVASIMRRLLTGYAVARRVQVDRSAVGRAVRRVGMICILLETARLIRGAFGLPEPKLSQHNVPISPTWDIHSSGGLGESGEIDSGAETLILRSMVSHFPFVVSPSGDF